MLQTRREEEELEELDDIGCCGLHVVSAAFHTGVKATEWNLQKTLHAMWKLLAKLPKRRGDFIKEGTVQSFPLKFVKKRWMENEIVATTAIQIWGDIVKHIKDYQLLCQSKRQQNNNLYGTLVKAPTDKLMLVKLNVFRDTASMLSRFLIKFHSDAPLVPFLSDCLEDLMRSMLKKCLI